MFERSFDSKLVRLKVNLQNNRVFGKASASRQQPTTHVLTFRFQIGAIKRTGTVA